MKYWRSVRLMSLVVTLSLVGCGSDGEAEPSSAEQPSVPIGELPCGRNSCKLPGEFAGARLCCVDAFAGTCGIKTYHSDSCRPFPKIDPRCPVPIPPEERSKYFDDIQGVQLFGCCTSDNMCGLDVLSDTDENFPVFGVPPEFQPDHPGQLCQPRSRMLCLLVQAELLEPERVMEQTCDGQPLELPADCKKFQF